MADLPTAILAYAEVALTGRLEDSNAIAHRGTRITVHVEPGAGDVFWDGSILSIRRFWVAACEAAGRGKAAPERWTCSAGYAHQRGAQACTAAACYPDAR